MDIVHGFLCINNELEKTSIKWHDGFCAEGMIGQRGFYWSKLVTDAKFKSIELS